jgi:5-methylcytosine-specific restriction endonuclease McrA
MLYIPFSLKQCAKCGGYKSIERYSGDKHARDGLFAWCKQCKRDYAILYKTNNREKIRSINRRWNEKHSEKKREQDRKRRVKDKDKIRRKIKEWNQSHPENRKASEYRRRALKRKAEGMHTAQQEREQYNRQKGRCYYCGIIVGTVWHVDHVIPLSRGGSNGPENIVIACEHCNTSKKAKMPHEWPEGGRLL